MKKIESLTDEQKARFPEFVDKWTRIGLDTKPLNMDAVQKALNRAFAQVKKPAPKAVRCTSPLAACLMRAVLASVSDSVRDSVRDSVSASVSASVLASVSASVSDSVRDSVRDSVSASVRDSVLASVSASVSDSVRDSVSASVSASVLASVRDSVRDSVSDYWWYEFGQYAAYWLAFYDYFNAVLGIDNSKLNGNIALCKECGWSWVFWHLALVSEKPTAIHRNAQGRLHKDGALALAHSDGWGVYALNGIRMKAEHVETPAEKISPESVLRETNADIRRELIRKVGIERMLAKLPHKVLHKKGDYELLSIKLSEQVRDARYLRMLNNSVGVFHLEGVEPSINTVEKALEWRNSQWFENAEVLT